jgi:hypothetical protein
VVRVVVVRLPVAAAGGGGGGQGGRPVEEAAAVVGARAAGRWAGTLGISFFLFHKIVFAES